MSALLATIVEWSALAQTALAALVGGAGVILAFSLSILGATKAGELRRAGRDLAAFGAAALAGVALVVSGAAIVVGILVMAS